MKISILRCLPKIIALQNRTISSTNRLSYVRRLQVLYAKDKKGGGGDKKCNDKKKPDTKKLEAMSKKCLDNTKKKGDDKCKEKKVTSDKKMTDVKGGSKCKDPQKKPQKTVRQKKKKLSCEQLLLKQAGMSTSKGGDNLKEIRGGSMKCPREEKKKEPSHNSHRMWQKLSLFAAIPTCVLLALFVFQTHEEVERGDFVPYSYKYRQTKGWFMKDPKKTPFHNSKINALPEGYEDEIDLEAGNTPPETDKQKAERIKEADGVRKTWKKKFAAREKEAAAAASSAPSD